MPTIGEAAKDSAVLRECVEFARLAGIAQAGNERGQHRQQRNAFAIDVDPEIERKPPAAALLEFSTSRAGAIQNAMAKAVLEFDPPAFALELRHRAVDKVRPNLQTFAEAEGASAGIAADRLKLFERLQPQVLKPVAGCTLRGAVAPANETGGGFLRSSSNTATACLQFQPTGQLQRA